MKATPGIVPAPKRPLVVPPRAMERAETRYELDPSTGCHVSTYSVASHGYAQIGWQDGPDRTVTLVHRVVWIAHHGPIPHGMTVDHMCKNRRCCNIAHLRLLTNYENARRTSGRDWPLGKCVNGHPNSDLYQQPSGKFVCRSCKKQWQARYDAKKRRPRRMKV